MKTPLTTCKQAVKKKSIFMSEIVFSYLFIIFIQNEMRDFHHIYLSYIYRIYHINLSYIFGMHRPHINLSYLFIIYILNAPGLDITSLHSIGMADSMAYLTPSAGHINILNGMVINM